jgi:hypothetical protein
MNKHTQKQLEQIKNSIKKNAGELINCEKTIKKGNKYYYQIQYETIEYSDYDIGDFDAIRHFETHEISQDIFGNWWPKLIGKIEPEIEDKLDAIDNF